MELNQIEKAQESYKFAYFMGRKSMEVWFKIMGSYSKQDIPIKLEFRCEKSIIQFIMILLVQGTCFEIQNLYSKALETLSLADWFAKKLLLYESSIHIKEIVEEHYNYLKEKYSDLLQEESEINKLLRRFDEKAINFLELKQQEDFNKKQKLIDNFNNFLYNKAECKEINEKMMIFQRKPVQNLDANNKSSGYIEATPIIPQLFSPYSQSQTNILGSNQRISLQMLNGEQDSEMNQQQQLQQQHVKNYMSIPNIGGIKNVQNRSLSEVPSFYNEQTTQITSGAGINQTQTSKFYSFYGNQKQNVSKNKVGKDSYFGNIIDQTPINSVGNSQLNTNRQSFSTHGLDFQSIINYPQNQANPNNILSNTILPSGSQQINQKNGVNNSHLNGSFNIQSPIAFASLAYYGNSNLQNTNQNSINAGGNSNNSSFIGQQLQFNNNMGSIPVMSDCHFVQGNANNNNGGSQITTPRNQDLSQMVSNPLNQTNQSSNINMIQTNKGNGQQSSANDIKQNGKQYNRRGTLEQTIYQFIDRPSSAEATSTTSKYHHLKDQSSQLKPTKKGQQVKKNISLNQHDFKKLIPLESTPKDRSNMPNSGFHPNNINNKNYLLGRNAPDNHSIHYHPSLKQQQNLQTSTMNRHSLHSSSQFEPHKRKQGKNKSQSQSKIGTFNNVNQSANVNMQKQQHKQEENEPKKLKIITSEIYINKQPPQFAEEPQKIEQLKQKYRFMRDDENDVREAQLRSEVKYRFMKIPLDQRRDLIDLDICMKKIIQEQLVSQTDHFNYPQMHWVCEKTLQQVNMDKKEFQFANLMVQFKQKNGNGKSIPSVLEKENTVLSIQRELKHFNEQTSIIQAKQRNRSLQSSDQMIDSQAFSKIINSNQSKLKKANEATPQEMFKDINVRSQINESLKERLMKAAAYQKQLDKGYDGSPSEGARGLSCFASLNQQVQSNVKNKKKISSSYHKSPVAEELGYSQYRPQINSDPSNTNNQAQIEKADYVLKQIVLFNEQEREQINKDISDVQNKHTKIGIKDLIMTLTQKEEDSLFEQLQQQIQSKQQPSISQKSLIGISNKNQNSNGNDENKNIHTQESDDNSVQNGESLKCQKSYAAVGDTNKSNRNIKHSQLGANINPTYFNLSYLKHEFGNMQSKDSSKSNIAFEVDKFLSLAQSTKNSYQTKLLKQNPFNVTDVAVLNKLKNQEQNIGNSSKHLNKSGHSLTATMPRRFTLLALQKKQD